jgi:hypothetical protein
MQEMLRFDRVAVPAEGEAQRSGVRHQKRRDNRGPNDEGGALSLIIIRLDRPLVKHGRDR